MRIKNLNNEQISTMIEGVALRYRVKCDELNNTLIRQTLQSEFSNLLVNDFNNSFIKHCSGRFMIGKEEKDNKPYGDLSAQFICLVINKFKEWIQKENAKPKLISIDKQLPMSKQSKEEEQKKKFEMIDSCFKETGEIPSLAYWPEAFRYMMRIGLIKITSKEAEEFREKVVEELKSKIKDVRFKNSGFETVQELNLQMKLKSKDSIIKECEKQFIINYYKNIKE